MKSAATLRKEAALPYDLAVTLFDYDPETGVLTWKRRPGETKGERIFNGKFAGKPAGADSPLGYLQVMVIGRNYLAHRIAFLVHHGRWPIDQVDHVNHIRADNRALNLREATNTENSRNHTLRSTNTSGVVGVYWDYQRGKWQAEIMVKGRKKYLGRFLCKDEAIKVRKNAEAMHGFNKNHGAAKPKSSLDSDIMQIQDDIHGALQA
jgi:hypothetical protein